jgi:predicted nucleic acid-binding protein
LTIVIDASALVELILRTPRAAKVQTALDDHRILAPDLINVEVLSTLRRLLRQGNIADTRAQQAVTMVRVAPVLRIATLALLNEVWSLRDNVTAYDAAYVALARVADCPLVTGDARLARASLTGVTIILV